MNFQPRNEYPSDAKRFSRSLFGKPAKDSYRAAVKQMVLDLQAAGGWDDQQLAEQIDSCKETVANWREEKSSMDAEKLLLIAYIFGEEAIAPVRALYLCRPTEQPTKNELIRNAIGLLNRAEGME